MDENMIGNESKKYWYTSEMQSMLHSFGDSSEPMLETCFLIEEVVYDQMISLMLQAAQIANSRGSQFLGLEDILFLMRKDKVKLARLFRYLSVKDMKASVLRGTLVEDEALASEMDITCDSSFQALETKTQQTKRIKLCYDFLSSIDQTGNLRTVFDEDFFDEIKHLRNLRLERITANMTESQYLKYFEARKVSFAKGRSTKFRDWLLKDNLIDLKPNAFALEILQYLAYETVAQIVDLAFLVRQDCRRESFDPVSTFISPNMKNSSVYESESCLPSGVMDGLFGATPTKMDTENSPKPKRLKNVSSLEDKICNTNCITPEEVREALRRYWSPSGPFSVLEKFGSKPKLLSI